jgi:hypothetical protein
MDANGDGVIEPNEINDRSRPFIQRLAQQAGLDPNAPLPVDRLVAATEQNPRDRSGPDDQARPNEATTNRNGASSSSAASTSPSKPADRLVPGFGEPSDLPAVPGFGVSVSLTKKTSSAAGSNSTNKDSRSGGNFEDDYNGPLLGSSSSTSQSSQSSTASSSRQSSSSAKPSRYLSPSERLPEGLPAWFIRADIDGDGQVTMAEFASQWTDAEAARFAKYDLNGDGIITPQECLQVEKQTKK